jgi:hypothetical protein
MRDLTIHELDTELAEQLPPRELMGSCWCRSGSSYAGNGNGAINVLSGNQIQVNVLALGNSNGNYAG